MTVQRGYDPRESVMVAYGGAGPLHAVAIARELNIKTVLIPPYCGIFSAVGMLLAEAGFPGGRGLPVFPVQVQNDSTYPRIMEAIQAMWLKELGVRSTIEPLEQKTWVQNQQSKQHVIGLMGWTGDYPDPLTFLGIFRAGGGNNWTGWASPAYDALLEIGRAHV